MRIAVRYIVGGLIAGLISAGIASPVFAESLRIAPLQYQTTLKSGERQKGYVDISNPEADTVNVAFEVKAFRQKDDEGGIEFYDDATVSSGVLLDLTSAELGPHEVLRLVFLIDGTKLPEGNIFAAVLAHTVPKTSSSAAQSVRVGTVLEITNGTPGNHTASITQFSAPFFQVGDKVSATFTVHNDDSTGVTGGFRPQIAVSVLPYSTDEVSGPLIFNARSRTVAYAAKGNYFGLVWLKATTGDSSKGQLVFLMTGYWRWLVLLLIAVFGLMVLVAVLMHQRKH